MCDLITSERHIRRNLRTLHRYIRSDDAKDVEWTKKRIIGGRSFAAAYVNSEVIFGPIRVVGYANVTRERWQRWKREGLLHGWHAHDAIERILGPRITNGDERWNLIEETFLELCDGLYVTPHSVNRGFWCLDDFVAEVG